VPLALPSPVAQRLIGLYCGLKEVSHVSAARTPIRTIRTGGSGGGDGGDCGWQFSNFTDFRGLFG
jgi:hypothetical protein